jgi:hypothetical protein
MSQCQTILYQKQQRWSLEKFEDAEVLPWNAFRRISHAMLTQICGRIHGS